MDNNSCDGAITHTSSCASNSGSVRNCNPQTILACNEKVFETGQIWSFCSGHNDFPLYYGMIQKIISTQVHGQDVVSKLHVSRLMATRFPIDVLKWEDKKMPSGCGTFYARKVLEKITPDDVSHQILPQVSPDGKEYTILPKTGEVWVIYRFWHHGMEFDSVGLCSYDIVEILDDSLNYEVLLYERNGGYEEDFDEEMFFQAVTEYKYNEIEGSEPTFTIPKSDRLRFSHKVPATRVTKEILGELKDLIKVNSEALPDNLRFSDF